jgi:hypothetical protein
MIRNNMMRNRRLLKEKERMDDFEYNFDIQWPNHLDENNEIIININKNVVLKIQDYYPFKCPKMYIKNIDHIDWFLKKEHIYKQLSNELNIKIKCICCATVSCDWTPAFGIKQMIEEYNKYNNHYSILRNFNLIYKKINGFDNLIYQKIINFLYCPNI